MKYYGLLLNNKGQFVVYTEGDDEDTVKEEMQELVNGGIPESRIRIVSPAVSCFTAARMKIIFTMTSGKVIEKSLVSYHPRRDFLSYCQLAITQKPHSIATIEMQDNIHNTLFRFNVGEILWPIEIKHPDWFTDNAPKSNHAFRQCDSYTRSRKYAYQ